MIENEAKIYDGKTNLSPVSAENVNPIISLPIKNPDLSVAFEQLGCNQIVRFARKRKIKRTKSAGIF